MVSDSTFQARAVVYLHDRWAYEPDNSERVDEVAIAVSAPAEAPRAEQVVRRFADAEDTPVSFVDPDRKVLVWLVYSRPEVLDWLRAHAPEELPPDLR